jgi:hypothetical protein
MSSATFQGIQNCSYARGRKYTSISAHEHGNDVMAYIRRSATAWVPRVRSVGSSATPWMGRLWRSHDPEASLIIHLSQPPLVDTSARLQTNRQPDRRLAVKANPLTDPAQYLFYDDLHPTTEADAFLAAGFEDVVAPERSLVVLLVLGLIGLALAARQRTVKKYVAVCDWKSPSSPEAAWRLTR